MAKTKIEPDLEFLIKIIFSDIKKAEDYLNQLNKVKNDENINTIVSQINREFKLTISRTIHPDKNPSAELITSEFNRINQIIQAKNSENYEIKKFNILTEKTAHEIFSIIQQSITEINTHTKKLVINYKEKNNAKNENFKEKNNAKNENFKEKNNAKNENFKEKNPSENTKNKKYSIENILKHPNIQRYLEDEIKNKKITDFDLFQGTFLTIVYNTNLNIAPKKTKQWIKIIYDALNSNTDVADQIHKISPYLSNNVNNDINQKFATEYAKNNYAKLIFQKIDVIYYLSILIKNPIPNEEIIFNQLNNILLKSGVPQIINQAEISANLKFWSSTIYQALNGNQNAVEKLNQLEYLPENFINYIHHQSNSQEKNQENLKEKNNSSEQQNQENLKEKNNSSEPQKQENLKEKNNSSEPQKQENLKEKNNSSEQQKQENPKKKSGLFQNLNSLLKKLFQNPNNISDTQEQATQNSKKPKSTIRVNGDPLLAALSEKTKTKYEKKSEKPKNTVRKL